ncbi:hypothetical protein [Pararobbsia alpina]|uniref:hypothetical protein n=1 Tax=Pararobbsia alpina TaxID=621374 RepID=UPI0039A4667E
MRSFPEIDYQQQLLFASLDDFTPNAALPNYRGGQYGPDHDGWRRGVVDFICLNVACGLLVPTHRGDLVRNRGDDAIRNVLLHGDANAQMPVDTLWNALYFNATAALSSLVDRHNMRNWQSIEVDVDPDFIASLVDFYRARE